MKEFQKKRVQSHSNITCLCWPGGEASAACASRWGRESAGLSWVLCSGGSRGRKGCEPAEGRQGKGGTLLLLLLAPCWQAIQKAFEEYGKKWGKMETARRLSEETRKQKPATTDLDYRILLV